MMADGKVGYREGKEAMKKRSEVARNKEQRKDSCV